LDELHETHPSIKAVVLSYLGWFGMNTQIEELMKVCPVHQEFRSTGTYSNRTAFHPFEQTCIYLADILVTGSMLEQHLPNLGKVLNRLQLAGIQLYLHKFIYSNIS